MEKTEIVDKLLAAKRAHSNWRVHAQCIVNGMNVDDKVPVLHTDCAFGKWYHGEGKNQLGHLAEFSVIDEPHKNLHETYLKIHEQLIEGGYTTSGNRRLYSPENVGNARIFLKELVSISDLLLNHLNVLEDKIKTLNESHLLPA